MSTLQANRTAALAIARRIVNHTSNRAALGVSVDQVRAMAHTLCAMEDAASRSADLVGAIQQINTASTREEEVAADEAHADALQSLTEELAALGIIMIEEPTHGNA